MSNNIEHRTIEIYGAVIWHFKRDDSPEYIILLTCKDGHYTQLQDCYPFEFENIFSLLIHKINGTQHLL